MVVMMKTANIFAGISKAVGEEQFQTLFENSAVKIDRIISQSYSSPENFWYDQAEAEWVIVLRGTATLEFETGGLVALNPGDHVMIPSHTKHRVHQTGPETVWLAVHVKGE
jgi:cupin 2 domain-containing protein